MSIDQETTETDGKATVGAKLSDRLFEERIEGGGINIEMSDDLFAEFSCVKVDDVVTALEESERGEEETTKVPLKVCVKPRSLSVF